QRSPGPNSERWVNRLSAEWKLTRARTLPKKPSRFHFGCQRAREHSPWEDRNCIVTGLRLAAGTRALASARRSLFCVSPLLLWRFFGRINKGSRINRTNNQRRPELICRKTRRSNTVAQH